VVLLVVTLTVLAGLVWAISPAHPHLKPAPLHPQPPGCPKLAAEFVPTNYTEAPGFPMESFSPKQRYHALLRMDMEPCTCGCTLSIACCLVEHPQCPTSKDLAQKIVAEERATKNP
jgi:hypothetical protein